MKALADAALTALSPELDRLNAAIGRPSIPRERLLKASLLIGLFSVCSERASCEQLRYNLLYRWFLDPGLMEPSFDPTVFTENRAPLITYQIGRQLFDEVLAQAHEQGLLSDDTSRWMAR